MSFTGSGGDDQSEDGELRHSPTDTKTTNVMDFSLSEEDQDTADSLDIKPPQVSRVTQISTSRSRRRERPHDSRSRHGRSDRHRERDKHRERRHREHSNTHREKYEREYREKEHYREVYREKEMYGGKSDNYKDVRYSQEVYRRDHEGSSRDVRMGYERSDKRLDKYSDKERYESEKRKHEERRQKSYADQALDDLRERLLDKRRFKETTDDYKHDRESRRKAREVEMDSEMYVKEIIDLSASDEFKDHKKEKHHHKREREMEREELREEIEEKEEKRLLTDAEREEQELRKEKLLEAEREIARQKEQYLQDRERRHKLRIERQEAKRKLAIEQANAAKRQRMTGELNQYKDKDLSIVALSDNSSESASEKSLDHSDSDNSDSESTRDSDKESRKDSGDEHYRGSPMSVGKLEKSDRSRSHSRSRSLERGRNRSRESSGDRSRSHSRSRSVDRGDRDSQSRSRSRSRSKSRSPTTNGQESLQKSKSPTPPKKIIDADLPPYFPAIQGCRSVEEFQCLNRIEEGTYGVVYRARDKRTDEIVALKRLKMEKEKEGFPITSLREINTLLKGQHPNIVTVREIVVGSNMDKIFIVMDYVEHDLKSLMETMRHKKQNFVPGEVKCLLKQLLGAVAHLHDNWILHRDLKTSNLLLSHKGILKVGDFGLAREYGSPLKAYTPIVVTLWYRAPELLLCCKEYSTPIDIWSVGCIFAELLLMNALFPGKSEVDQLNRIFKDLGTPNEKIWPGYNELPAVKKMKFTEFPISNLRNRFHMLSELGLNLLQRFLTYDPAQRVTAEDALKHPYFSEVPLPIDPAMFPTWPAKSELGHRKALAASPKPPSGGREYKQLGDGDEDSALGFHMGSTSSASMMENRRLAMGAGFSLKF